MSKPIYRRHVQRSRRYAKERSVTYNQPLGSRRMNISDRLRAEAERLMSAIENHDWFEANEGAFQ